jgi:S1-C subfamily serine protease
MRKLIIQLLLSITALFFLLSGCLNIKVPNKIIRTTDNTVIKKENSYFPIESFVMTTQEFVFSISCENDKNEECIEGILGSQTSMGSGFILETSSKDEYIVTAGHICMPPKMPMVPEPLASNFRVAYRISLTTGFGREGRGEIVAIDTNNDICLLKANKDLGPGLEIAQKDMMLHSKVYNMANPAGLSSPLAVPVFDGYYIGDISMISLFTVPAVGGSSGSPIMNHKNEVVSIVSAAAVRFDEYAIGPKTRSIREFLLAHLPDDS